MAIWPFKKPLHPLITVVLDLVNADHAPRSDPWTPYRSKEDSKWLWISRTVADRLYLQNTGSLCVLHEIDDEWETDYINLTDSEKEVLKTAYDEIMRKRAIKIVEYRSSEKDVIEDLCS